MACSMTYIKSYWNGLKRNSFIHHSASVKWYSTELGWCSSAKVQSSGMANIENTSKDGRGSTVTLWNETRLLGKLEKVQEELNEKLEIHQKETAQALETAQASSSLEKMEHGTVQRRSRWLIHNTSEHLLSGASLELVDNHNKEPESYSCENLVPLMLTNSISLQFQVFTLVMFGMRNVSWKSARKVTNSMRPDLAQSWMDFSIARSWQNQWKCQRNSEVEEVSRLLATLEL